MRLLVCVLVIASLSGWMTLTVGVQVAQAAMITWGPVQDTMSPAIGDIVPAASVVEAINYGPATGTLTVNGVVFANSPANVGSW